MVQLFPAFPGQVPLRSAAFAELTEPGVTDHLWPACSPAGLALSLAQKLREGRDLVFWGRRTVSGDDPRFADRGFHPRVPLHFPLWDSAGMKGARGPSEARQSTPSDVCPSVRGHLFLARQASRWGPVVLSPTGPSLDRTPLREIRVSVCLCVFTTFLKDAPAAQRVQADGCH